MPGEARKITPRDLVSLPAGKWIADPATAEATALEARGATVGAAFYFRFQNAEGKRDRLPLGRFDAEGVTGLTVAQARDEAARLTARIRAEGRDLRAAIEADSLRHRRELEAEAARKAAEKARQQAEADAATAAESRSLGKLCEAYTASLEARGAVRVKEVAGCLRLHVQEAFPDLWATPADALDAEQLLEPVARLVAAKKTREAGKLRSYLRAAYAAAVASRTDPSAPATLRALKIRSNPAAALSTVKGSIRARQRALTAPELVRYFARVQELPSPHRELLTVHLLLGAQRVEQLARLTVADWNTDAGVVTLADPKGRREQARPHPVPVLAIVARAFNVMRRGAGSADPHLWTLTAGRHGCTYQSAADAVEQVAAAMLEAGEVSARFTLGDLRRTVESVLAGLGVPLETRAHLQSHGLSGVQQRFYVRHDFHAEKLDALRMLWSLVDPQGEAADRAEAERLAALAAPNVRLFRRSA